MELSDCAKKEKKKTQTSEIRASVFQNTRFHSRFEGVCTPVCLHSVRVVLSTRRPSRQRRPACAPCVQALSSLLSVLPLSLQERNRALLPSPRNYRRICFSKSVKKQKTFFPLKTTTITLILNVQCFSLSHTDRNSIIASPILIVWILIFFPFYCFVFVLCF